MKKVLIFLLVFNCALVATAQNAQEIIDDLKKELKDNPEPKKRASIYSDLTWYYSNISIDSAMLYGQKAIDQSLKIGDSTIIAQAYGDVSTVYLKKGDFNQSLKYMKNVLEIRKAKNDILGLAKVYSGMGLLYYNQNEYNLSMKNYLKALDYVNKTDDERVKYNIQNAMSGLLIDLKDYKKAMKYSESAIKYYEKINSTATLCPMYINRGNIYLALNDTLNALKFYEKGKLICDQTGNKLFHSKALNNIGNIKVAQKKYEESKKLFNLYNDENKGIKSEFMSYKMKINDADELIRSGKFNEAKHLLNQLETYFEKEHNLENLLLTYKYFVPVYAHLKQSDSVSYYHSKFIILNKKLNDANVLNKTVELETKYQTAVKEKLLLEKEAEVKTRNSYIVGLSFLAFVVMILGFLIYRQQKLKNKQQEQEFQLKSAIAQIETQNQLQEQRLAISRDLHDNIGAQLTFVISSVDNLKYGNQISDSRVVNQLTKISDFTKSTIIELRDTIWAMNTNEFSFDDLRSRIFNFIEKAKSAKEDIVFKFNVDESLKDMKFSSIIGINLYRTIQEAVNNAVKYSEAKEIEVSVNKQNETVVIEIKDNGKGFDSEFVELGNGLNNMKKRIEEIGGKITINSNSKGTVIGIVI
ncbi:MAG: sensor histidine kinase [Flavobacteriales bacterium]|nr:sensor histidine kinase [Flavobacteriales bacterium]